MSTSPDPDAADEVGPGEDVLATFEASLRRLDVDVTRTAPSTLRDDLAAVATEPAVGARLPFPGASLPDWVRTDPTPDALEAARTGVSPARLAVADYGSVALPATPDGAEPVSLFPPLHVPVVRAADVVPGMPEAFAELGPAIRADRGSVVLATGPSATADMGALVRGAHGPREVHVLLLHADDDGDGGTGEGTPASGRARVRADEPESPGAEAEAGAGAGDAR
jgi:L-lactate dehydrogenase complex protein LldG